MISVPHFQHQPPPPPPQLKALLICLHEDFSTPPLRDDDDDDDDNPATRQLHSPVRYSKRNVRPPNLLMLAVRPFNRPNDTRRVLSARFRTNNYVDKRIRFRGANVNIPSVRVCRNRI